MEEMQREILDSEPFRPEEIVHLEEYMQPNMSIKELNSFKNRLNATLKMLKIQQRLCEDRIDLVRDMIDETDFVIEDLSD